MSYSNGFSRWAVKAACPFCEEVTRINGTNEYGGGGFIDSEDYCKHYVELDHDEVVFVDKDGKTERVAWDEADPDEPADCDDRDV